MNLCKYCHEILKCIDKYASMIEDVETASLSWVTPEVLCLTAEEIKDKKPHQGWG